MTNSTLYGNDYDITEYMIDLENQYLTIRFKYKCLVVSEYLQIKLHK